MKQAKFLIILFFIIPSVYAAPITLQSTWSVWQVNDPNYLFDNLFQMGDVISLSTTLELSVMDTNPDSLRGQYLGAITNLTLTVGTSIFSGSGSATTRASSSYIFGQQVLLTGPIDAGPISFVASSELLHQSSDSLLWMASNPPRVDASVGMLSIGNASITILQQGNSQLDAPIPAAAWMFGSSLIGLIGASIRRLKVA